MNGDQYTGDEWMQMKRWVENWKTLGPKLERMREEEIYNARKDQCSNVDCPEYIRSILGLYPYEAYKGVGSTVILRLSRTPDTSVEAAYVRIEMCGWWIRESCKEIAHSESSDAEIVAAVLALKGKRLNEITLLKFVTQDGVFHGAELFFDDRITMKLQQYEDSPADHSIFVARNSAWKWISYNADGQIRIDRS
jgi:hypothetical protein